MSSSRLGVKKCHLQKTFQGDNPKPALTPSLAAISGLFWHPRKLGWFSKKHRQYHLLPRAAVQAGKLEKKKWKPEDPNPSVLRQYKGVTYSKAKKRWLAQSLDEHTILAPTGKYTGLLTTRKALLGHWQTGWALRT